MGKGASPSPFVFLGFVRGLLAVGRALRREAFPPGPSRPRALPQVTGLQMTDIESLSKQALADIEAAATADALESLRGALRRQRGRNTTAAQSLGALPAD